ncbi:uncharacterized protein UBRO_00741 [Ustilago bromivora]|uniref:Uncharacterized protein n=1 Tax=Ustilago bromivora TaxID=307758 RepID=A0A1K0FWY8_9BASI|nr:uncharacterized protein UBRO_00741 [Ustilago bromivora]SYW77099.1 uncharacterized protein UBRO2_01722 [Ustilago bromivora]
MATATPLSLPFVLRQNEQASSSQSHRRCFKPNRPNYRALLNAHHSASVATASSSRLANASKLTSVRIDTDQLEADLQEWGLPSTAASTSSSSLAAPRLTHPTSAISWDENSVQSTCSYLRSSSAILSAKPASLDQWDPSISFAPFASSGLEPVELSTEQDSVQQPFKYDPGLGRVIAIGREDGTISIYRAYGRIEDYEALPTTEQQKDEAEDSLPASASASANLSHASISASCRFSVVSNPSRLRSPEIETPSIRFPSSTISSSGREPSPLLSNFSHVSHVDRSPITARSTISAASVSSTVAANVQLEEGLPAGSLQSNVTATGHTAGRVYTEQAENRLEQQIAAAERNDHQHGVVGGVIERLGLSFHSHSPPPHQYPSATHQHSRQSYHRTRSSESRRPSAASPHAPSSTEVGPKSPTRSRGHSNPTTTPVESLLKPPASDSWLHDPTRGSFSQVMTLFTCDRSPVVALRLVPLPSAGDDSQDSHATPTVMQPTTDKAALLVVQEAGNISLWSILEGSMLWQTDVTTAQIASFDTEMNDPTAKESSASLSVMQSLGRQLPAAIGTPLPRSPAGSARASPRPTFAGGDASMRRSMLRLALGGSDATANPRLCEGHGVKLDGSLQTLQCHGHALAAVWDSHSCAFMIIDLTDGRLSLHEDVDDVHSASIPTVRHVPGSENSIELVWCGKTEGKLKKQPLKVLTSNSTGAQATNSESTQQVKYQGIVFGEIPDADKDGSEQWALADDQRQAQKIYFVANRVLVLSSERLSVLSTQSGQTQFTQEAAAADQFKRLFGSSRDGQRLLFKTITGLGKLDLVTKSFNRVEQHDVGNISKNEGSKANFTSMAANTSARLHLTWNTPGSGASLDKVFLLQPLAADDANTDLQAQSATELAALNLADSRLEDLLSDPKSSSVAGPSPGQPAQPLQQEGRVAAGDRVTAILPLSLEKIAVASSGGIRILPLKSIAAGVISPATALTNSLSLDHQICLLRSAVAPRSGHRLIVGGTLEGGVGFWTTSSHPDQSSGSTSVPVLEATLSVSTTPVEALVVFGDEDNAIRLHGCVACICADSSVTIVLLESFRPLYTVPGRGARLTSLAVRADELLLTYDDDKARVWDLQSQELRRSIATYQAQALVEDGKGWWTVKTIKPYSPLHSGTTGVLSPLAAARDEAAAALLVDLRRAVEAAARSVRAPATNEASAAQHPFAQTQTTSASGSATAASLQPPATLRSEQDMDKSGATTSVSIGSPAARKAVNIVRPLLPTVFPIGLDTNMDAKLAALLDLDDGSKSHSAFAVGLHSTSDALMVGDSSAKADSDSNAKQAWKLGSRLTTTRLLSASALLRVLGNISELRGLTEELQQFVEDDAKLSSLVGVGFRGVTLTELVPYWLDSNPELQSASRAMFHAALTRLDEKQLEEICTQWQGLLTSAKATTLVSKVGADGKVARAVASGAGGEAELRTRALALLGSIAVERYTSLSPKVLKDIASTVQGSITSDKGSEMRLPQELQMLAVAIELCRSGFSMWQHYFDATEVVHSLFALSTSTTSSGSSGSGGDSELRALARSATLQIAAENTPLFMTTLSLDILHARSAAHCAATMRLVAFMVRKRPSVLVANLPRLAEAVVKSLDPTHTTMREAVVNAATVMISELVSTYPSVSFFGGGQRLAVGTHEGAVIMYDLKTATRLYVLEGHRRRADAASFSPDGRRLVTMSLEEGRVLVWKTSSGFSSFFSPGQMPRQGTTDVKLTDGAYKAFLFNVGDQQHSLSRPSSMVVNDPAASLVHGGDGHGQEENFVGFDKIGFQWNSERSVRVQIGEAQLNISVD